MLEHYVVAVFPPSEMCLFFVFSWNKDRRFPNRPASVMDQCKYLSASTFDKLKLVFEELLLKNLIRTAPALFIFRAILDFAIVE